MSRETVVCTTSKPVSLRARRDLGLRRERPLADELEDRALSFTPVHICETLAQYAVGRTLESLVRPRAAPRPSSGGARRTTSLPSGEDEQAALGGSRRRPRRGVRRPRRRSAARDRAPRRTPGRRASPPCSSALRARARSRAARRRSSRRRRTPQRTTPGCRRRSSRDPRATNPPSASSATSSAPIGRPLARPLASVTRSGRTPSCSKAKNDPVRPTPVCTSSKQSRGGELSCRAATNSALERDHAAFAEDRLEQDQADLVVDGARTSASTSFGGDEAHAGHERGERRSLRRLPGHRERAERPAVEATFERDDTRLARSPCART